MKGRGLRALALACVLVCVVPAAAWAGASPTVVGWTQPSPDLTATTSVAVAGHYAYTTAYHAGELTAVDISSPSGTLPVAGHSPSDPDLIGGSNVAISGGYAFVVSKNRNQAPDSTSGQCATGNNDDTKGNSLTILDIHTDPANPSIVGTLRDTNELFGAYGIAVSGHYAYVAYQGLLSGQPCSPDTSTGGFSVIDFSGLAHPKIVANIDNGALPSPWAGQNLFDHSTSVAISGTVAYVTAFYANSITAVDISDPVNPQILGTLQDPTNMSAPADVVVQGQYAYVADQVNAPSPTLTVINISDPTHMTLAGDLVNSAPNGAYRIRVRGDFAYLSGSSADTISAVDITQPTAPRLAGFVYDLSHLNRTTGLDLDSTGAYVVASSPYLSTESNTTYPPYPLQTGGPPATGTISMIQLDPNPIAVTIAPGSEPANPTTSTSASFSFSVNDNVSAVQCTLDGVAGPCTTPTSQSYPSLAGGCHTFSVQATDSAGHTSTASYAWTVDVGAPVSCAAPSISGTAAVGQTLTAAPGTWAGAQPVSTTNQWEQCDASGTTCAPISGQTGSTYAPTRQDLGHAIKVLVTATNGSGTTTALSGGTAPVVGPPAAGSPGPSISGTASVGQTLTASPGSWSAYPAPGYTYQWQRCGSGGGGCAPIAGATGSTYTAGAADAGHSLLVTVTARNSSGSASANSAATTPVTDAPANGSPPAISGKATVGSVLQATNGSWSGYPAPALSDSWLRCNASGAACTAIGGANSSTYKVSAADVGHTIRLGVNANNAAGSATSNSRATGVVPPGASGTLTGAGSGKPLLKLAVTAGGQGTVLSQVTVALPAGLSFASQRAALHALSVRDGGGHRLAYKAALHNGALVITLHKPAGAIAVTLTHAGLHESLALQTKIHRHRVATLGFPLAIKERTGQSSHENVVIRPA